MSAIDNSRAAFPNKRIYRDSQGIDHEVMDAGMTLRDWFAGQAVAGLLAHPMCKEVGPGYETNTRCEAEEAYSIADAMLAARRGDAA